MDPIAQFKTLYRKYARLVNSKGVKYWESHEAETSRGWDTFGRLYPYNKKAEETYTRFEKVEDEIHDLYHAATPEQKRAMELIDQHHTLEGL